MQILILWLGRAALLAVLAVAVAGAIDPHHNAARNVPTPDVVEHVAFGYLLTLLTIISLPRLNPLWIGAGFLALQTEFGPRCIDQLNLIRRRLGARCRGACRRGCLSGRCG